MKPTIDELREQRDLFQRIGVTVRCCDACKEGRGLVPILDSDFICITAWLCASCAEELGLMQ